MSLSERIRPNSEAAPWVIEEVKAMEAKIKELEAALQPSFPQDVVAVKYPSEEVELEWYAEWQKTHANPNFSLQEYSHYAIRKACEWSASPEQATPPSAQDVPTCTATAPFNIWLCVSDDESDHDEPFPENVDGVTWCHEPAVSCSVEYFRIDIVEAMIDKATAELQLLVEDLQKELKEGQR